MLPEAGAFELIFIAALALIVVGPKDLPILLRKIGQFVAKMRGLAAEFRASFDELARQSELDELRKEVEALKNARIEPQITQDIATELGGLQNDVNQHFMTAGLPSNPALSGENPNTLAPNTFAPELEPATPPKVRRSRSTKKPGYEPYAEADPYEAPAPKPVEPPKSVAAKKPVVAGKPVAAKTPRKVAPKADAAPTPKRTRRATEQAG